MPESDRQTEEKNRMSRPFITLAACLLAVALSATALVMAFEARQKNGDASLVRDYLIANPEVLLEAQAALEEKQQARRAAQSGQAVAENRAAIYNSPQDITLGNLQGDVTIVEFFDYNCGFCKRALADMDALLEKDGGIRFVLKEFPILGPDSVAAHRVSNALRLVAPERYPAFHRTLLGGQEAATEESALALAATLGVDQAKLRQSMADAPNDDVIRGTYELATKLGLTGTPSYVIGDEPVFGAVGLAALEEKVANMRACGKAACPPQS